MTKGHEFPVKDGVLPETADRNCHTLVIHAGLLGLGTIVVIKVNDGCFGAIGRSSLGAFLELPFQILIISSLEGTLS